MPPNVNRDYAVAVLKALTGIQESLVKSPTALPPEVSALLEKVRIRVESIKDGEKGAIGDKGEQGISITNAQVKDKELIITFSDKKVLNLGCVYGQDGKDAEFDEEALTKRILALIPTPEKIDTKLLEAEILGKVPKGLSIEEVLKAVKDHTLSYEDIKNTPDLVAIIKKYTAHLEDRGMNISPGASALSLLLDVDVYGIIPGQVLRWTGVRWTPYTPSGTGGTSVYNEVVAGSGTTFTLAHIPTAGTLRLYARGQRLLPTTEYSLASATITTVLQWGAGDIYADYVY